MGAEHSGSRWTAATRLAVGLAQGLALAFLWSFSQTRPLWAADGVLYPILWVIALYVPLILLAGIGVMRPLALAAWALAAAVLLALVTAHDVWRDLTDLNRSVAASASEGLLGFAAVALFVLHHLVEAADVERRWRPPYAAYFAATWRHAFQLPLALVFTGLLWGLLGLGSSMFAAIGLKAVADVLSSHWLVLPLLGLALAFAVQRTDAQPSLVQGVRGIGLTLLAWLLPVATLLAAVFLPALLLTGLAPLWATRSSTSLLLLAAAALIVFTNAAYQDGRISAAIPRVILWSGRLAGLLLVPLVALASWSLALRIGQYGLSPQRVEAAMLCAVAAVYACGYAWAALARGTWMRPLEAVNLAAAVVVVVAILLVLSPVADPARLAVASQVARLETGKVAPERFDFAALKFSMARYGREALARLAASHDPRIAALAGAARQKGYYEEPARPAGPAFALAVVRPAGATLPPGFREAHWDAGRLAYTAGECVVSDKPCDLYVMDLDGDGDPEVVALSETVSRPPAVFMRDHAGAWRMAGFFSFGNAEVSAVAAGRVAPIPPLFSDLRVGDRRLFFVPTSDFANAMGPIAPAPPAAPSPQ